MPRRKIPPDAFDFYFGLGPGRSYQAVAGEYGVCSRVVERYDRAKNVRKSVSVRLG